MFVLRLSVLVQASQKIFRIINKQRGPNKHWGRSFEKNPKLTSGCGRRGVYLILNSNGWHVC